MLLSLFSTAWACPPTAPEVVRARVAFEDAEVDAAQEILHATVTDLACQTSVVETAVLLELYRLDALVALSQMDSKAAVYSTIRAVAVEPDSPPPATYGPELARLHATWAERLSSATATLSVVGEGTVWLDGRALTHGTSVTVPQGEHLIQLDTPGGFTSAVQDVTLDGPIDTGVPVPGAARPQPVPNPGDVVDPLEELESPDALLRPDPVVDKPLRKRPVALWVASAVLLAGGAGAVGYGAVGERNFKTMSFDSDDAVDQAASRVRLSYGAGYGMLGVGAILMTTNAVGFPVSAGVHGRW